MYFDGDFNYVHGRILVYEFEETLRASQASQNDYKGVIKKCTTSDILPNIEGTLVSLALQIVCIPKADIEKAMEQAAKQAAKETAEKAIEILTNTHEPSAKKKIMLGLLPLLEVPGGVVPIPSRMTKPDENSTTTNIIHQVCEFAQSNGLYIYTNKSLIFNNASVNRHRYSKYAYSKPDFTIYPRNFTVITTKTFDKMTFIQHDEDDGEIPFQELSGKTLSGEVKPSSAAGKDPIGQLIAGMDKTLGDMFDKEIVGGSVLTKLTMYGLYFVPLTNDCEVIRAKVNLDQHTIMSHGQQQLTVQDGVNRVFYQLLNPQN